MGTRYIGSKARIVDEIMAITGPPVRGARFIDAFAGTGAVAAAAADAGWPVAVNDHLLSSTLASKASLLAHTDVPFTTLGSYAHAVELLNDAPAEPGFLHDEYSPAGDAGRRYFTAENAARIDTMRAQVAAWRDERTVSEAESDLLVADLIAAANRVANIAGTYGCYLSNWSPSALRPIAVQARELRRQPVDYRTHQLDAADVPVQPTDVVYLDPPYTKRQYAAYYHVPETIAHGDRPAVGGKTGLRPWQHLASRFCYRRKAHEALVTLVRSLPAGRVLLSYSNEGHVDLDELAGDLKSFGEVETHAIGSIGRYRPNRPAAAAAAGVNEFVIEFLNAATAKAVA